MTAKSKTKPSATAAKGTVKELKAKMDRKALAAAMQADGQQRIENVLACLKENNCRISSLVVMRDGQEVERRYEIFPNFN